MTEFSRRAVLLLGAYGAASAALGNTIAAPASRRELKMRPPDYADVTLLDGPLLDQFRRQHATLLGMNNEALLKPFQTAAGLPAPGPDLGGWYNASPSFDPPADMHGFIPGHSFGQYVSSLARAYAITHDEPTRQKVLRLVDGYAKAVSAHFYEGYPLPAYTFDKLTVGLIDAHQFAQDPQALKVLDATLAAALPRLPEKALTREEMSARPHPNAAHTWDESYTLPENLFLAWRRGAGEQYRELAARYLLDSAYFDPLARGENVLPGKHAYSHMNALSSAMQAYLSLGDTKYLKAAQNGFDFILAQSFATGGWGPNEGFIIPGSGALGESLGTTHSSFEAACGAYGHFKAARYLLSVTDDGRYGDSMERVLYNTVLGVLPMHADGTAFYYADYNFNGAKSYFEYKCPCCSGTLGQIVADYGISAYFLGEPGPTINLYVPSRLQWRQGGRLTTLTVKTAYPLADTVQIDVGTPAVAAFTVALRIPAWAGPGTGVAVNGKPWVNPIQSGAFYRIERSWKNGDRIELTLDRTRRLEAVDAQHPKLLALLQGPLALFAVGERFLPFTRTELLTAQQAGPGLAEWSVTTRDGRQRFKPYYAIEAEATRLYHPVAV
jgi:uncharacterized protein